ncbi:MAG: lactonase family protein [Pirellulales bacterium]
MLFATLVRACGLMTIAAAFIGLGLAAAPVARAAEKCLVYIGTYTSDNSQGIYRCELDLATGQCSKPELVAEIKNASFLAIHPNKRFLYAVSEISDLDGKPTGGVSAFAIDPSTGALTPLNQQSSQGAGPCHVTVDKSGHTCLVANYGGGSVAALPIDADGKLGPAASVIQHQGSSVNKSRQEGPHAHSINVDPANHFAVAADLGLDKVLVYRLDPATSKLTANDPPLVEQRKIWPTSQEGRRVAHRKALLGEPAETEAALARCQCHPSHRKALLGEPAVAPRRHGAPGLRKQAHEVATFDSTSSARQAGTRPPPDAG